MRGLEAAFRRALTDYRPGRCLPLDPLKTVAAQELQLERLAKLSGALGRTEASLLREALDELIERNRGAL